MVDNGVGVSVRRAGQGYALLLPAREVLRKQRLVETCENADKRAAVTYNAALANLMRQLILDISGVGPRRNFFLKPPNIYQ